VHYHHCTSNIPLNPVSSPSSRSAWSVFWSGEFVQSQEEQRPVHFNYVFCQAQHLVEHPDLQSQLTFSKIPSGASGMVIHLVLTCPSFSSQQNSLIEHHAMHERHYFTSYKSYIISMPECCIWKSALQPVVSPP
jgi:hypothetical protein